MNIDSLGDVSITLRQQQQQHQSNGGTEMKLDGFFKDTKNGKVFHTRATNLWRWGKVEVGSVVECEDHETEESLGTITVAAIGSPFELGSKKKVEWVYLYTQVPVATKQAGGFVAAETPDEPLERLEAERFRGLGSEESK